MKRKWRWQPGLVVVVALLIPACAEAPSEPEVRLVVAGQALIKVDPNLSWEDPFGSLRPILQEADVAFTNFEMAVKSEAGACGGDDESR